MAKNLSQSIIPKFTGGLNIVDNSKSMPDGDLTLATNIQISPFDITSIDGPRVIDSGITVNSVEATKQLGAYVFNNLIYIALSNDIISRLFYSNGINAFTEITTANYNPDNKFLFSVFDDNLYFVNGTHIDRSYTITSITNKSSITKFADAGAGQVTVTIAGHDLTAGESITISGTTSYNGTFTVSNITTNTFDITDTWVANDATGTCTIASGVRVTATGHNLTEGNLVTITSTTYSDGDWDISNVTANTFRIIDAYTSDENSGTVTIVQVLNILSKTNVLTGISSAEMNNELGLNYIAVHLSRIFTCTGNKIYVSKLFPVGLGTDWDVTTYEGGDTAGIIQVDLDDDNDIVGLIDHFGNLAIFRKDGIHYMTGQEILNSTIVKKTNINFGVIAPSSLSKADKNIYFYGINGVQVFSGISVEQGDTKFDSMSTIGIDRKIRDDIESNLLTVREQFVGICFKDKYYLSNPSLGEIYVYDELNDAWSIWNNHNAQQFVIFDDKLYCGFDSGFYEVNADITASVTSEIRTKEYNLGTDLFKKMIHRLLISLKTLSVQSDVIIRWYINGEGSPVDSKTISVPIRDLKYDSGFTYDSGLRYDSSYKNFFQETINKSDGLKTCDTISLGIQTTGLNRFSLSSLEILFELLKKET